MSQWWKAECFPCEMGSEANMSVVPTGTQQSTEVWANTIQVWARKIIFYTLERKKESQ